MIEITKEETVIIHNTGDPRTVPQGVAVGDLRPHRTPSRRETLAGDRQTDESLGIEFIVGYGERGEEEKGETQKLPLQKTKKREREREGWRGGLRSLCFGGRKEEIGVDRVCLLKGQGDRPGQHKITFTTEINK